MKGLFIPGITAEMFRSGCLESIEALMSEGKIFDIETDWAWIPVSEMLPEKNGRYLVTNSAGEIVDVDWNVWVNGEWLFPNSAPIAWMPLPEPYQNEVSE